VIVRVLLDGSGSGVAALATVAVLVSVPVVLGVTAIVTVAMALAAMVPITQRTLPAGCVQVTPALAPTDATVTPVGSVSVSTTPTLADGPVFVTVSV
jgi:hypothetical protein